MVYQDSSALFDLQTGIVLDIDLLLEQPKWFRGFCHTDRSPFSITFFQHNRRATSSMESCSCFKSSFVLSQPLQYCFQLIGGPESIQYPPGLRILSTSVKYSPSVTITKNRETLQLMRQWTDNNQYYV